MRACVALHETLQVAARVELLAPLAVVVAAHAAHVHVPHAPAPQRLGLRAPAEQPVPLPQLGLGVEAQRLHQQVALKGW